MKHVVNVVFEFDADFNATDEIMEDVAATLSPLLVRVYGSESVDIKVTIEGEDDENDDSKSSYS